MGDRNASAVLKKRLSLIEEPLMDLERKVNSPNHHNNPRPYAAPWHFLYFFPLPQGHGSLRPTLAPAATVFVPPESSPPNCSPASSFSFLRSILRVKSSIWRLAACFFSSSAARAAAAAASASASADRPDPFGPGPPSSSSGYGITGPEPLCTCKKYRKRTDSSSTRSIM